MLSEFSLAGRTAIVVGGARGLGREMLCALAAAGAHVAAVDVLAEHAQEAAAQAAW
jgi:NAD(P)-dependent dehydrogenase (short-subunit alcohol dehydrogenase family)